MVKAFKKTEKKIIENNLDSEYKFKDLISVLEFAMEVAMEISREVRYHFL